MKTKELIERLRELDPEGNIEVYTRGWSLGDQDVTAQEVNPYVDRAGDYPNLRGDQPIITL